MVDSAAVWVARGGNPHTLTHPPRDAVRWEITDAGRVRLSRFRSLFAPAR